MNAGHKTVEWLYRNQLAVDPEWSVQTARGFTWWADKNAQTIEVIGEEEGPDGEKGYLISVRTAVLRNLDLTDRALTAINATLMAFSTMAGPVYDANSRTLSLCSLVRVYDGIQAWMNPIISVAAVLQLSDARSVGPELGKLVGADPDFSGPPKQGLRPVPDEMATMAETIIAPVGQVPCKWPAAEFEDVVDKYMQQPPSLGGSNGGQGFTVEFPYGTASSLCQGKGKEPNPRYGNGLFLLQSFPVEAMSDVDGARLALDLNATELTQKPSGYGFGSYCYRDGTIHFVGFLPNAIYRPGLLPNIYFACAGRAREMSIRLAKSDWTEESYAGDDEAPQGSALAKWLRGVADNDSNDVLGRRPEEIQNIDPDLFYGRWQTGQDSGVITLNRGGTWTGPEHRQSGTWFVRGNAIVWLHNLDIPRHEDVNPIVEQERDRFVVREANGAITVFTRVGIIGEQ